MLIAIYIVAGFAAINVAAHLLLASREASKKTHFPFLRGKMKMDALTKTYPDEKPEDILGILETFYWQPRRGSTFQMRYSPFTEHEEAPYASEFLNIDENGCRSNGGPVRRDASSTALNVAVFGNSTTLGYGVRDSDTFCAVAERTLMERHPQVQVMNFGRQSYISTSQLVYLQKMIQQGVAVNVAVFVEGLNDVFHNFPVFRNRSRFSDIIEKAWPEMSNTYFPRPISLKSIFTNFYTGLTLIFNAMPVVDLGFKVRRKLMNMFSAGSDGRLVESWNDGRTLTDTEVSQLAGEIADLTTANWKSIKGIARAHGIEAILALQPVYYFGCDNSKNPFMPDNTNPGLKDVYTRYYEAMRARWADDANFLDLSTAFETISANPFCDSIHYSPYGHKVIGEAIANRVAELQPEPG